MLNKIKTISEVLELARSEGIPGAATAIQDLCDINGHMIELDGLNREYIQKALEDQVAEAICNGDFDE